MKYRFLLCFALVMSSVINIFAQEEPPKNWFNLDPTTDSFPGVSTERTYQNLLKGKQGRTVVVAVLDSGVDYKHEDLKDIMWTNPGEIAGNGMDDDKNGYVDDVHGWNFIGGKDGKNVYHETYEVTRLYKELKAKYDGKNVASLSENEKKEYNKYLEYKKVVEDKRKEAEPKFANYEAIWKSMQTIEKQIGKDSIRLTDIKNFKAKTKDRLLNAVADVFIQAMNNGATYQEIKTEINYFYDKYDRDLNYAYNPDYDARKMIVGDNYADVNERYYGNNDVYGPHAQHGTHVAGIIGAKRGNGIGMDGVADNVRIMSVRVVPDGDERDKDVANAIYYAVDNGAAIINMSFGKGASPQKEAVDKAVKYAAQHDVLIVHAAGNDSEENNAENNFPNDKFKKKGLFAPKFATNWLEVGASNWEGGENSAAEFSNYSKEWVDVFAPGTLIYSTVPDNKYENLQGTSMASPVAAGVAAVLRSYFPDLDAQQVKNIMIQSVTPVKEKVYKPGTEELVPFSDLAVSAGEINLYKAVEVARQTKGKRKFDWNSKGNKVSNKAPVAIP